MQPSQSSIESGLPAVFVHVTDLQRAVHFYTRILGLSPSIGTDFHNGIFVLPLENGIDLILDASHADQQHPSSLFHMHAICMFSAKDIDAAYAFMQANDVEIVTEIHRDPNVAFFNFKDPDGNIQMICCRTPSSNEK